MVVGHAEIRLRPLGVAVLPGDLRKQLRHGFAGDGQHLHQQRGGVDAVLAGDMPPHGHAAGGLAADDRVGLRHLRGHPFEAHRHLIALLAQTLRHPIQQVAGGVVADAGAVPAPVLHQIVVQQHQQLVGGDEPPLVVDNAQPVGVAVGGDAQIAVLVQHQRRQRLQRIHIGCGQLAAEQGIVAVVDDLQIAAAGGQQHTQAGPAHAVHRVKADAQRRFFDGVHIHGGEDAVQIFIHGIGLGDKALFQRLIVVHAPDVVGGQLCDLRLDAGGHGLVGVAASGGEHLDAVVDGGVVAGGNGDAVGLLPLFDGEHHQWRGAGAVDDEGVEAVAHQHLRRPVGGFLGQKPPVIAHADLRAGQPLLLHQAAQPRHQQTDVLLGKLIGDDGAPAAGTEFDHRPNLLSAGRSAPSRSIS